MLPESKYLKEYYSRHRSLTLSSAKKIIKLFPDYFDPKSILDIGCGSGEWILAFQNQYPLCKLTGIDGHWIKSDELISKSNDFIVADLNSGLPVEIFDKKYDLISCLETITDLPKKKGEHLIHQLCKITNLCLFSSGTPIQTHGPHKNRQWQSYWHNLFEKNGFKALDFIRSATWNDSEVGPWYSQNCFLFVEKSWLEDNPRWQNLSLNQENPIDVVHPMIVPPLIQNMKLKKWLKILPRVLLNTFKK